MHSHPKAPLPKALSQVVDEIAELGIRIEAVFFRKAAAGTTAEQAIPGALCRYINDTRLLDAHEQLVLGPATAWLGDCMRREPWKRDAFECYSEASEATAQRATRSFERFWMSAKPASTNGMPRKLTATPHDLLDASLIANADPELTAAVLRH